MDAKQTVKITEVFGEQGKWAKSHVGMTGRIAESGGQPVKGVSGNTYRVDLPTGGCLFVEPEALEAVA